MKKVLFLLSLIFSISFAQEVQKSGKLILKLDTTKKYNLNDKYAEIEKFDDTKKRKKSSIKVDIGTNLEKKEVDSININKGIKF